MDKIVSTEQQFQGAWGTALLLTGSGEGSTGAEPLEVDPPR